MLVYPSASVAMPRLRPRPHQEKPKRAFRPGKMGMGVDAIGLTAESHIHGKWKCTFRLDEMLVLPPVQNP
eukprot:8751553-Lingulodinium_polyedra.AAC.1